MRRLNPKQKTVRLRSSGDGSAVGSLDEIRFAFDGLLGKLRQLVEHGMLKTGFGNLDPPAIGVLKKACRCQIALTAPAVDTVARRDERASTSGSMAVMGSLSAVGQRELRKTFRDRAVLAAVHASALKARLDPMASHVGEPLGDDAAASGLVALANPAKTTTHGAVTQCEAASIKKRKVR